LLRFCRSREMRCASPAPQSRSAILASHTSRPHAVYRKRRRTGPPGYRPCAPRPRRWTARERDRGWARRQGRSGRWLRTVRGSTERGQGETGASPSWTLLIVGFVFTPRPVQAVGFVSQPGGLWVCSASFVRWLRCAKFVLWVCSANSARDFTTRRAGNWVRFHNVPSVSASRGIVRLRWKLLVSRFQTARLVPAARSARGRRQCPCHPRSRGRRRLKSGTHCISSS